MNNLTKREQRTACVLFVYTKLFNEYYKFANTEVDNSSELKDIYSTILEEKKLSTENIEQVLSEYDNDYTLLIINLFFKHKTQIFKILEVYSKDWSKTSLFTKSLLTVFLIEVSQIGITLQNIDRLKKTITRDFLYICAQYDSKQTQSAVHAIILKLLADLDNEKIALKF